MPESLFSSRSKASSHDIGSNSPAPRSLPFFLLKGRVRRAGDTCFMMPLEPLAQITPLLSGCAGLPSM
jgi:hypothetical protein